MSVEDRMERTTVGIWRVLAVVVAVALMVNAVQAVAGKAEFAWCHGMRPYLCNAAAPEGAELL